MTVRSAYASRDSSKVYTPTTLRPSSYMTVPRTLALNFLLKTYMLRWRPSPLLGAAVATHFKVENELDGRYIPDLIFNEIDRTLTLMSVCM